MWSNPWDYKVRLYYGRKAGEGQPFGELALETKHKGARSRDMEIYAAKHRPEIGRIEVQDLHKQQEWEWTIVWTE